jgi:hypothetical protein
MATAQVFTRSESHRRFTRSLGLLAAGAATILVTTGAGWSPPDAVGNSPAIPVAAGGALKGLFKLDPASCASGPAKGSFFRMIQPGGGPSGPFIENNTSACGDKTYTDLAPGKDGGLSTAGFQPQPDPPFAADGAGTNDKITQPKEFFGAKFATATNEKDPQTGANVPPPSITHDGKGKLSGDLRSFAAAYQRQHFNQGSPKPDGSTPGLTAGPTGTFDAGTKRFSIEWRSTIVGGPFNNFTGVWHFEGVFQQIGAKAAAAAPPAAIKAQAAGEQLKGLFRLNKAECTGAQVSGSHFRMIQPGGSAASGPYLQNNSSACADKSYTDLTPGKDGGLSTAAFQPQPNPPFDASNGGANDKITMPKEFFGAKFATATNQTDPQTSLATVLPVITHDGNGKLSGDLRAFAAAYQGQHFNQGAPKPDGSMPGATTLAAGTYDAATKKFAIEWASTIVGGPFNNFTGKWHFEGTFEPVAGAAPATTVPTAPAGQSAPSAGTSPSTASSGGTTGSTKATKVGATPSVAAQTGSAPDAAIASTGLRTPLELPAVLIGAGLVSLWLGRRPVCRPAPSHSTPGGRP